MTEDGYSSRAVQQEQDELAEMELSDRLRADAEEEEAENTDEIEYDNEIAESESTEPAGLTEATESAPVSAPRAVIPPSISVTPALGRTGDVLWGREQKPRHHSDLDDLFEVPDPEVDNDVYIDDLFEIDEDDLEYEPEDDLSDLTRVTNEDVMGVAPRPRPPQRFRRTGRPYYNPPSSLGGTR